MKEDNEKRIVSVVFTTYMEDKENRELLGKIVEFAMEEKIDITQLFVSHHS